MPSQTISSFPDPERFNAERSPNRHGAFGHGIHYCLGAQLARLQARIAIGAMFHRFSSVALVPGSQLERLPSLTVYGKTLPITLTAGCAAPRVGAALIAARPSGPVPSGRLQSQLTSPAT